MAIEPSIALGVKPLQLDDPLAQYNKLAALQNAQQEQQLNALKMQEYQRGVEDVNAMRRFLPGLTEANAEQLLGYGTAGRQTYESLLKGRRESREAAAAEGKLLTERINQSRAMLEGVTTPEQYLAWHEANHRDPILSKFFESRGVTQDTARAQINTALQTPGGFEKLLMESKLGAAKAAEMAKPHFVSQDTGGATQVLQIPSGGGAAVVVPGSRAVKGLTPEQARGAGLERLIVADKIVDDAGNVTLINKFGQVINPTEAVGTPTSGAVAAPTTLKGKSTPEKGKLTEAEGKATGFALRAQEAHDRLSKLDFSPYAVATKQAVEQTPVLGGLGGALTNIGMSEANQRADQAQREFVNAVLRQESGAAISQSEFENARKQYFPQPGDKPGVIEQKRKNRETAIKSLEIAGGKGMEKVKSGASAGTNPSPLTAAEQAELDALRARFGKK